MTILPWILTGILVLAVIVLAFKVYALRKSAVEIQRDFEEKLTSDTNTLISLSCRDARMRSLAAGINIQLRRLREDRQRFQQGDLALKEAITNISHDLRTPLAAIRGYLDLLIREELSQNATRYLTVIHSRTRVLEQLTEDLLRYSIVTSAPRIVPCEDLILNHLLEESISAHYAALKKAGIAPNITIPEEKVCRRLNKSAISRIFANLIGNAIKYSGGDLTIRLQPDGRIEFSNQAPGLDNVQTEKLFDRFYTVETGADSAGLGLSIAKLLTRQMGGHIYAEYSQGRLGIFLLFPANDDRIKTDE